MEDRKTIYQIRNTDDEGNHSFTFVDSASFNPADYAGQKIRVDVEGKTKYLPVENIEKAAMMGIMPHVFGDMTSDSDTLSAPAESTMVAPSQESYARPAHTQFGIDPATNQPVAVGQPSMAQDDGVIREFIPALEQGGEQLYRGGQMTAGQIAKSYIGSSEDYTKAKEMLDDVSAGMTRKDMAAQAAVERMDEIQAEMERVRKENRDYRKYKASGWEDVRNLWQSMRQQNRLRKKYQSADEITDPTTAEGAQFARAYKLAADALEDAGYDKKKAIEALSEGESRRTWGDRQVDAAVEAVQKFQPTEGFAAFVGGLIPQMAGNVLAIGAGLNPITAAFAPAIGAANMGMLTLASAGGAMADAEIYRRQGHDVSSGDILRSGLTSAVIEAGTEFIPFNRYFNSARQVLGRKMGKKVADAVVSSPSAVSELGDLLSKYRDAFPRGVVNRLNIAEYGKDVVAEGLSEFVAEGGGALVQTIYQNPEDYPELSDILSQAWDGAKAGLFMGAFLGAGSTAASSVQNKERQKRQGFVNMANTKTGVVEIVGEGIDESGNVSYTVLRPNGKVENMAYGDILESARIPYDTFDAYMKNPNEANLDKANEEAVMIESEERENNRRIKVNTGLGLPADADIRFRENGVPTNEIIGVNITDDNGGLSKGYLLGRTDGIDGSMAHASVMLPDGNVVPVNADRITEDSPVDYDRFYTEQEAVMNESEQQADDDAAAIVLASQEVERQDEQMLAAEEERRRIYMESSPEQRAQMDRDDFMRRVQQNPQYDEQVYQSTLNRKAEVEWNRLGAEQTYVAEARTYGEKTAAQDAVRERNRIEAEAVKAREAVTKAENDGKPIAQINALRQKAMQADNALMEWDKVINERGIPRPEPTPVQQMQEQAEAQEPAEQTDVAAQDTQQTDYDALLESDPASFMQAYSSEFGQDAAAEEIAGMVSSIDAQIEKNGKALQKETSINRRAELKRQNKILSERREILSALVAGNNTEEAAVQNNTKTPVAGNEENAVPVQQPELFEGNHLSDEVDGNGHRFVVSSNGTTAFGEIREDSGLTPAPIKLSEGFNNTDENGNNIGYGRQHIEANHGDEIRNAGYSSVDRFVEDVTRNYNEIRIGRDRKNNKTYMLLELHDEKHKRTLYVELSHDGSYWNVNNGGIFRNRYTDKNDIVWPVPTIGNNADTDIVEVIDSPANAAEGDAVDRGGNSSQPISSASEDTNSIPENQENPQVSRPETGMEETSQSALLDTAAEQSVSEEHPDHTNGASQHAPAQNTVTIPKKLYYAKRLYDAMQERDAAQDGSRERAVAENKVDEALNNAMQAGYITRRDRYKNFIKSYTGSEYFNNTDPGTDVQYVPDESMSPEDIQREDAARLYGTISNTTRTSAEISDYKGGKLRVEYISDGYPVYRVGGGKPRPVHKIADGTKLVGYYEEGTEIKTYDDYIAASEERREMVSHGGTHGGDARKAIEIARKTMRYRKEHPDEFRHSAVIKANDAKKRMQALDSGAGKSESDKAELDALRDGVNKAASELSSLLEEYNSLSFEKERIKSAIWEIRSKSNKTDEDYADLDRLRNEEASNNKSILAKEKDISKADSRFYDIRRKYEKAGGERIPRPQIVSPATPRRATIQEVRILTDAVTSVFPRSMRKKVRLLDSAHFIEEMAVRTDIGGIANDSGSVAGFVDKDGNVFINVDEARIDTPLHEIGIHKMIDLALDSGEKELYSGIIRYGMTAPESIKQYVRERYGMDESSPLFYEEVAAAAFGMENDGRISKFLSDEKSKSWFARFKEWVIGMWNKVRGRTEYADRSFYQALGSMSHEEIGNRLFDLVTSGKQIFEASKAKSKIMSRIDGVRRQMRTESIEEVNSRFNEELSRQSDGTLEKGYIYRLGMPGDVLRSTGFPDLPIELSSVRLIEKSYNQDHPFDISEIKNLPIALQNPIAVFSYGDGTKAQNVIVEIEHDGKNFLVGVHFNQSKRGVEINDIRGLFPRDTKDWLNWILQGKMLYVDKMKIQTLIDQQRTNLAEVEYLDLDSIANIVENFENPKTPEENYSDAVARQHRPGDSYEDGDDMVNGELTEKGRVRLQVVNSYDAKASDALTDCPDSDTSANWIKHLHERGLMDTRKGKEEYVYKWLARQSVLKSISREDIMDYVDNHSRDENPYGSRIEKAAKEMGATKRKLVTYIVDAMHSLERIQDELTRRGGTIDASSDAYMRQNLEASAVQGDMEAFEANQMSRAIDAYGRFNKHEDVLKSKGFKNVRSAVADFLVSLHAPERNRHIITTEMIDSASSEISKVDSSIRDSVRDEARAYAEAVYDGKGHARIPDILPDSIADAILEKYESVKDDPVRAGVDSRGIAFTDERAAQVQQELRDIFSQEDIDNLISSKDAVIDFVLDYNLRTGLVAREEYDRMKSMYEHYVPLRGWNDEEIAANRERMEGNIFGRSSSLGSELDIERRAKGRITEAADPLASLMSMAQNAIVNGQRNRTLNALVNMYRNNAERMGDMIYVTSGDIDSDSFAPAWVKEMATDMNVEEGAKHGIIVRVNGVPHKMFMFGEEGAGFINAYKELYRKSPNWASRVVKTTTRFRSNILTTYNPSFWIANAERDIRFGMRNLYVMRDTEFVKDTVRNLGDAFVQAFNANVKGNTTAMYREFMQNGGRIGFFRQLTSNEIADKMNKEFELLRKKGRLTPKNAVRTLFKNVRNLASVTEELMRYATYMTARQHGESAQEAAYLAHEVTANLSRRGTQQAFSMWSSFFNATIQGMNQVYRMFRTDTKKAMTVIAADVAMKSITHLSALAIGAALIGGDDDDDEGFFKRMWSADNPWWKVPEYVRKSAIIIPMGVDSRGVMQGILIQNPHNFRAVSNIVDRSLAVSCGVLTPEEATNSWLKDMIDEFAPFNMSSLADDDPKNDFVMFVPSIAQPVAEVLLNRKSMGGSVRRESNQKSMPKYMMAKGTSNDVYVGLSKMLNTLGGGSEAIAGRWLNISPESMQYFMDSYLGFPSKVFNSVVNEATRNDAEKFRYGSSFASLFSNMYYVNRDRAMYQEVKRLKENVDERITNLLDNAPEYMLGSIASDERTMEQIRDEMRIIANSMYAEYEGMIKELEDMWNIVSNTDRDVEWQNEQMYRILDGLYVTNREFGDRFDQEFWRLYNEKKEK